MISIGKGLGCGFALLLGSAIAVSGNQEAARGVSPGARARVAEATSACPTFSWSAVAGAEAYRLALFETLLDGRVEAVYTESIEGAALSWTPPRERCLLPGREYAWVVRAERGDAEVLGSWSAPLRFRVPGAPSPEELAAALAVLERWRAAGGTEAVGDSNSAAEERAANGTGAGATQAEASTAAGIAAIRGEVADVSGEAYGVFGISHSPQGAGLVARNESAGADLILDGAAQNTADTLFTESGIDRPSASAQTFEIRNSGAGSMTLTVDGAAVSLVGHGHAGEAITSGTVADARIASTLARDSEVMEIVLANDGPGSWLDADTLDGVHGASLQARVTGVCPPGEAVVSIGADGTVECLVVDTSPKIRVLSPDESGTVELVAMDVGADGLPVIAFTRVDPTGSAIDLIVLRCGAPNCLSGGYSQRTVETFTLVAEVTDLSIAIGPDGNPVIAYSVLDYSPLAAGLRVAKCDDPACGGGGETISWVVDLGLGAWFASSVAIGSDGLPVISFEGDSGSGGLALWVAKCDDPACTGSGETFSLVDEVTSTIVAGARMNRVAIGADGFPVISYLDLGSRSLKFARCNDLACAGGNEVIRTLAGPDDTFDLGTSIAIDADGNPVISWYRLNQGLGVVACADPSCSFGFRQTVDPTGGRWSSLAIAPDGLPVIAHYGSGYQELRLAKCDDTNCFGGNETTGTIDGYVNRVGRYPAIAIGADGLPIVAYADDDAGGIRVMKCSTPACGLD